MKLSTLLIVAGAGVAAVLVYRRLARPPTAQPQPKPPQGNTGINPFPVGPRTGGVFGGTFNRSPVIASARFDNAFNLKG